MSVVVVTGASGGVGRAVARRFAARGDRVALLARGPAGLSGAAGDVRGAGGEAMTLSVDIADAAALDRAAASIEERRRGYWSAAHAATASVSTAPTCRWLIASDQPDQVYSCSRTRLGNRFTTGRTRVASQ